MINVVSSDMTLSPGITKKFGFLTDFLTFFVWFGSLNSKRTLPFLSSTFKILFNFLGLPVFAKVENACANSVIFISPPPRVRERPYLLGSSNEVIVNPAAEAINSSTPLIASIFTAGILYEFARAYLNDTGP